MGIRGVACQSGSHRCQGEGNRLRDLDSYRSQVARRGLRESNPFWRLQRPVPALNEAPIEPYRDGSGREASLARSRGRFQGKCRVASAPSRLG